MATPKRTPREQKLNKTLQEHRRGERAHGLKTAAPTRVSREGRRARSPDQEQFDLPILIRRKEAGSIALRCSTSLLVDTKHLKGIQRKARSSQDAETLPAGVPSSFGVPQLSQRPATANNRHVRIEDEFPQKHDAKGKCCASKARHTSHRQSEIDAG